MLKSDLHDAVRVAQLVLDKGATTIPVRSIRMMPGDGVVRANATDLEVELEIVFKGSIPEPLAVEAHVLRRVLDASGNPNAQVTLSRANHCATFAAGNTKFTFPRVDPEDCVPFANDREKSPVLHTGKQNLLTLLEVSDFPFAATCVDFTRAQLARLFYLPDGTIVGTDGHRVHIAKLPRALAPFWCAIPRPAYTVLRKVQSVLDCVNVGIEIRASAYEGSEPIEHLMLFTMRNAVLEVTMAVRVDLTLMCPAYEQTQWPLDEATVQHTIEKLELEEAVELVKKVGFFGVVLSMTGRNTLLVRASEDLGKLETALVSDGGELPLSPDRDGILPENNGVMKMTPTYLLSALSGMSGKVKLSAQGALTPLIIDNEQNQCRAIIMGHVLS